MEKGFDFSGWATRNDLLCSDGRTIRKDAFIQDDGRTVPMVWNHQDDSPANVLGHAVLENRKEGVYAYCYFNDTESGQIAKEVVKHGDVESLSIRANKLKQRGMDVLHGKIRELSLVLAGANPGAFIDNVVLQHGDSVDNLEDEAIIYNDESIDLTHADASTSEKAEETPEDGETIKSVFDTFNEEQKTVVYAIAGLALEQEGDEAQHSDDSSGKGKVLGEKTLGSVFNTLNEKQKNVAYAIIGSILSEKEEKDDEDDADTEEAKHSDENKKEDTIVKHNVFDQETEETQENTLSHGEIQNIIKDAKKRGSLRDTFLQHGVTEDQLAHAVSDAGGNNVTYGVANIDYLFPDARTTTPTPDFISRDMDWVGKVVNGAKHTPFSRIKSVHANITMEEARAKGYIKGNEKTSEVFALLKRTTSPTTIYKKQKLDRDDIVDITDFDVVAWVRAEMRLMLNEEIARAILVSDGRVDGTDDKIDESCIRPIYSDNDTYVVRKAVTVASNATDDDKAKAFIRNAIKARKDYKGSGNPTLFTTEDMLTDCLLLEDGNGHDLYDSVEKLRTKLRVKEIVTVPVMENMSRSGSGTDAGYDFGLMGIFVNMADYTIGADKGGAINMFEDFDIDFNQEKYLIETRCSGALTKYHSAIVVELKTAAAA